MFTSRYFTELPKTCSKLLPTALDNCYWLGWNAALADEMQLPARADDGLLSVMAGKSLFQNHQPLAQKYGGHQFGVWNPELGDGRGLLLGEWQDPDNRVWEMHLKGSGRTPYSRFGDGRAVVRSSIREFLGSEAVQALGIASTRALALVGTGEQVHRETVEPGARLLRVSESHLRFGHFEWFAFANQKEQLRQLVDFTIRHHYPQVTNAQDPVLALYQQVIDRTAKMIAGWMAYGFVHGVMNTDNMSIVGETFDYGPYGFIDQTNLSAVFNHSDELGRYAFHQQPAVALWNLRCLGQALASLTNKTALTEASAAFNDAFENYYYQRMSARLVGDGDLSLPPQLVTDWLQLIQQERMDYNESFRLLTETPSSKWGSLADRFVNRDRFRGWLIRLSPHLRGDEMQRQQGMRQYNPVIIARSHHLQAVIAAAEQGDLTLFNDYLVALQHPFEEREEYQRWRSAPEDAAPVTLSCSS